MITLYFQPPCWGRTNETNDEANDVARQGLLMRAWQVLFARFVTRFSSTSTQIKLSLQMGDERVVAHMD